MSDESLGILNLIDVIDTLSKYGFLNPVVASVVVGDNGPERFDCFEIHDDHHVDAGGIGDDPSDELRRAVVAESRFYLIAQAAIQHARARPTIVMLDDDLVASVTDVLDRQAGNLVAAAIPPGMTEAERTTVIQGLASGDIRFLVIGWRAARAQREAAQSNGN